MFKWNNYGKSGVLICEIMGSVRIFWKEQTSILGQIVSEILVMLWWLHTNPSKFDLGLNV